MASNPSKGRVHDERQGDDAAYAEVKPAADPADAGVEWRSEKLKDFAWRARCLGIADDPEVEAMIRQMRATTADLDVMAAEQAAPNYPRPWWKDGEYDEERAEAANDRGMKAFGEKRWGDAFDEYTEAIRLEPRRPGYHANRAAAALKLGRHRCAADDAAHAIERDPRHLRAHLRAATAHLNLREPDNALALYTAALAIEPSSTAAAEGKAAAARATGAAAAERATEAAAARAGTRAPLPSAHSWPDLDTAAEALLAAEEVLQHNRNLEGAKAAVAEACVLCGRFRRALEVCEGMFDDSADRAYLRAEALWRSGALDAALKELERFAAAAAGDTAAPPAKVVELGARLARLKELMARGMRLAEDGQLETAERALSAALELPDMKPTWWEPSVGERAGGRKRGGREAYPNRTLSECLRRRAAVRMDLTWEGVNQDAGGDKGGRGRRAEADLDECLAIDPEDITALTLRARLRRESGDYQGAFMDLRKAQQVDPDNPSLAVLVANAARMALPSGPHAAVGTDPRTGAPLFYRLLGVEPDATAKQIRRGYRRAAAKWHPDKWTAAGSQALAKAEKHFRRVAVAYETLGNAHQRRLYDQDPRRFEDHVE